jgi:hypothetical protein
VHGMCLYIANNSRTQSEEDEYLAFGTSFPPYTSCQRVVHKVSVQALAQQYGYFRDWQLVLNLVHCDDVVFLEFEPRGKGEYKENKQPRWCPRHPRGPGVINGVERICCKEVGVMISTGGVHTGPENAVQVVRRRPVEDMLDGRCPLPLIPSFVADEQPCNDKQGNGRGSARC